MNLSFIFNSRVSLLVTTSVLLALYFAENVKSQFYILLLACPVFLILYTINIYKYWENAGISFIPASFPFGYMKEAIFHRMSFSETILDLYTKAGNNDYVGVYSFTQPQILIKDVELVKRVLVKDFSNFADRGVYVNLKVDKLTGNLFSLEGQMWKNLRAKISPTFTSGKMKTMYLNVKKIANDLVDYTGNLRLSNDTINIKDLAARYGLDVISSVALGLEGNNFKDDSTDMKRITELFIAPSKVQMMRTTVILLCRDLAKLLRMRMTKQEVEDYFFNVTKDTIKYRKENNIQRNDFMHLLMNLEATSEPNGVNENNIGQFSLSMDEMAAQSFVFVIAGYETTSVTFCFMLYELAMHPDVQERLIQELDSVGPNASYEELQKLTYCDMVLNETLRKHAVLPVLQRECTNDYVMPDGKIVKAGTVCIIPVIGLHRDEKLFPEPEKFDPERFNKENIKNIKPYSFIPFGEGPRICIGNRFALMQLKLAMVQFFSRFTVMPSEKTPKKIIQEKNTFLYTSEGGLWLRIVERTN